VTLIPPREPIAIVRLDDLSASVELSRALLAGGVGIVEFTLTNHKALDAVENVREHLGDHMIVGAGTVLDAESARSAILAGAQFLVTPVLAPEVIDCGRRYGVPVMCGALTPTEILSAWQAGADFIKVFPARTFGPAYIKDVLAPLPMLRLVPTGGVDAHNCRQYLEAGAYTVALGSNLVNPRKVSEGDWEGITRAASQVVSACRD